MSWYPIETAPKDGTILDLKFPRLGVVKMVWWSDDGWVTLATEHDTPTHWRKAKGISQRKERTYVRQAT